MIPPRNLAEYTVTVTVPELDYVMNCLSQRPFGEVNGFIQKIMNQVNGQKQAQEQQSSQSPPPVQ